MAESIEDMLKRKDEFQKKANELKDNRNKLHDKSKTLADDRDKLNSNIREIRNKISEHKQKRDELNERVKHTKEQRNILNKSYSEVKKKIEELTKERSSSTGANINNLKKQLKTLENEQMTTAMSPQKEKKLIEAISELASKIKVYEDKLNKDPKLKKALEEEKVIKQKAEKQHDLVEKLATRAQEEHENMMELIKQLDNMIKKVNEIQETIVMTKIEADKVHKEFIECVDKIHELERTVSSVQEKKRKMKKAEEITVVHKEANKIFEKFKRGEKLSTEDLMALQKAGLI
ncbi:MAG: hypothetical protein JSV67_04965 [Thermoplasmatales archaeon]|jgi:uncharacterized coiled-coil DUF342 family protein|nr:MAG: hypothetical protein JSV67_04965 [Thermoplasmatales archaeon]